MDLLPNWIFWFEIEQLANQVREAGGPIRWVNRRIVQFLLGAIGSAVFGVVDYIELIWSTITYAFVSAGQPLSGITSRLGVDLFVVILDVHEIIRTAAGFAGPLSPVVVLGTYAVVFYLVFLVLRATAPAATDALGSIPVIGSAFDAALTFMLRLWGGLTAYAGGDG
jgi:hypothetical protein